MFPKGVPRFLLVWFVLSNIFQFYMVAGHGRLMEPPNRSSLWRFPEFADYKPVKNYDDNQLFCGGFKKQYKENGGRCGPCGDPFNETPPRENETGGKYGKGIIAREYRSGQVMEIAVELTKSHKGYFQFRLCNPKVPNQPEVQPCFNENLLALADGTGRTKYPIIVEKNFRQYFYTSVKLPDGLTCNNCVLQWHYRTGNSWGNCTDGTQALGCGNQEVFRGCADIAIR